MDRLDTLMKPFIDNYKVAQMNYLKLLTAASIKWKGKKQMDETIFDNITDAIEETVKTADLMLKEAKGYMDGDIDLAREAHSTYHNADDDPGDIIEATGHYFNILFNRNDMMKGYAKAETISRKMYNQALLCHNTALADQAWWSDLVQILKSKNKTRTKGSTLNTWMQDFQDKKQPDATYKATKALNDARCRHKKSKRRQEKPKKKQSKSK